MFRKLLPAYWNISKFFPQPDPTKPGSFKFQNWNFLGFAVSPSFQCRGIGKALLKTGIDEVRPYDMRQLACREVDHCPIGHKNEENNLCRNGERTSGIYNWNSSCLKDLHLCGR